MRIKHIQRSVYKMFYKTKTQNLLKEKVLESRKQTQTQKKSNQTLQSQNIALESKMILLANIVENHKHLQAGKALEQAKLHHCLDLQSPNRNRAEEFKVAIKNLVGHREFLFLKRALEFNIARKAPKNQNNKLRGATVGISSRSKYHDLKQQF